MDKDFDPDEQVRVVMTSGKMQGKELAFWQGAEISRGLDRLASSFSVGVGRGQLIDAGYSYLPVRNGDGVEVYIGNDLLIVGYLEKGSRKRSSDEHGINLQGRSIAGDLVDSSAANQPGQWSGAATSVIAKALCDLFKVPVSVAKDVDRTVPNFEIEQGEKVCDSLARLAHTAGALLFDTPPGVIKIARPGQDRAVSILLHRDGPDGTAAPDNNVIESTYVCDDSKRFSHVIVKGQSEGGISAAGASGEAFDHGVSRYRPLIISPPGQATAADCTRLAQWEVARRAGQAITLTHLVRGWRQSKGGPLWTAGLTVHVIDDQAELERDFLITEVKWKLDNGGRTTELTLQPPEALQPKPVIDKHADGATKGGKYAHVAAIIKNAEKASGSNGTAR